MGKLGNRNTIFNLQQNLIWYNLISSPPPTSHRFFSHPYQPTLCSFSIFFNETEQNKNQNKTKQVRQINKSQNEWNKRKTPQNQINSDFILCLPTAFDLIPVLKCGWHTQLINILMERTHFPKCQQVSPANNFLVKGGMSCSLPLLSSDTPSVLDV